MIDYSELIERLRGCEANCSIFDCEDCAGLDCEGYGNIVFKVAADAIEELQSQMPRWIPMVGQLPERNGNYIVYVKSNVTRAGGIGLDRWNGREWLVSDASDEFVVTHWMLPPAPPEVES